MQKCRIFICLLGWAGSSCTSYQAYPLAETPTLADAIPSAPPDQAAMPLVELAEHRFDPSDGLDQDEVAILAVSLNADIMSARHDERIASAQAEVAGQLPNPQLVFGRDFTGPGASGGVSYDFAALLAHGAAANAASAEQMRASLSLLWQQWQVVQQARLLTNKVLFQQRLVKLLQTSEELAFDRYNRTNAALRSGDAALDSVAADTISWQEVRSKKAEALRLTQQLRRDLNSLLNLKPGIVLNLVETPQDKAVAEWSKTQAVAKDLAQRRPDLLALKAAYSSQEFKVRGAVLAQFPALNIGMNRVRDSSGLLTSNFGVSLTLPLFHGAGAVIALEQATREKLHDEYQKRLNTAYAELEALGLDHVLVSQQAELVRTGLPELATLASNAGAAYASHNIDALTYTTLRTSYLNKQIEKLALEELLVEQGIALQTILGQNIQSVVPKG